MTSRSYSTPRTFRFTSMFSHLIHHCEHLPHHCWCTELETRYITSFKLGAGVWVMMGDFMCIFVCPLRSAKFFLFCFWFHFSWVLILGYVSYRIDIGVKLFVYTRVAWCSHPCLYPLCTVGTSVSDQTSSGTLSLLAAHDQLVFCYHFFNLLVISVFEPLWL